MKKVELTVGQYERLMALRDHENISLTITTFVKTRFNATIQHKACDKQYSYCVSLGMSVEHPYSYRRYKYTVIFEHDDEQVTWFMIHI